MAHVKNKISNSLYLSPRILSILFLLFLTIFSFDVFDSCNSFLTCLLGLFIHNIPVFILAILLWISWKHEIVGAITFIFAGLLYILQMAYNAFKYTGGWYMLSYSLIIAGPAFFIAYLFWLNWKKK